MHSFFYMLRNYAVGEKQESIYAPLFLKYLMNQGNIFACKGYKHIYRSARCILQLSYYIMNYGFK